jgi:hypothetical protein
MEMDRVKHRQQEVEKLFQQKEEGYKTAMQTLVEQNEKLLEHLKAVQSGQLPANAPAPQQGLWTAPGQPPVNGVASQQQGFLNPIEQMKNTVSQFNELKDSLADLGMAFGDEKKEEDKISKKDQDQLGRIIGHAKSAKELIWGDGSAKKEEKLEQKEHSNPLSHILSGPTQPQQHRGFLPGWGSNAPQQPQFRPQPVSPTMAPSFPPPGTASPYQGWGGPFAPPQRPMMQPPQQQFQPMQPQQPVQQPFVPPIQPPKPALSNPNQGAVAAIQALQVPEQTPHQHPVMPPQQTVQAPVHQEPVQQEATPAPAHPDMFASMAPSAPAFSGSAFAPTPPPPTSPAIASHTYSDDPEYNAILVRAEGMLQPYTKQLLSELNERSDVSVLGNIISAMLDPTDKATLMDVDPSDGVEVVRQVLNNPPALQSRAGEQWVEDLIKSIN